MKSTFRENLVSGLVWTAFIVLLFVCGAFFIYTFQSAQNEAGQRLGDGGFGDAFGAVNAAFTGLALFSLGISIILQRHEIRLVKAERNDTIKLLASQKTLLDNQTRALAQQVFEASYSAQMTTILTIAEGLRDEGDKRSSKLTVANEYAKYEYSGPRSPKAEEHYSDARYAALNVVSKLVDDNCTGSQRLKACIPIAECILFLFEYVQAYEGITEQDKNLAINRLSTVIDNTLAEVLVFLSLSESSKFFEAHDCIQQLDLLSKIGLDFYLSFAWALTGEFERDIQIT
jgi:hypothetical protein